jgi:outer membrane protein TolC
MISSLLIALVLTQAPLPVLTLEEALEEAHQKNPDLQAAQARLEQARALSRKAWAGYLPQASVGGTYLYNSVEARIAMPAGYYIRDMGNPIGPPFDPSLPVSPENPPGQPTPYTLVPAQMVESIIQRHHQLNGQLEVSQGLVLPALWSAIQGASLAEQAAGHGLESARQELLFAVAQLYYSAEGLREAVGIQQEVLDVNLQHERDAETRYRLGAVPKVSYLRAQIERTRAEQDLVRTRNAYASVRSSLAALLDREPDFEVTRPTLRQELPGELEDEASERRPDLKAARVSRELAKVSRQGVFHRYLPSLVALFRVQASNARGFTGQYAIWMGGVALNWNLWDGGLRQAELREASAKLTESEAQLRAAENRVRDEVRRARLDLESAEANRVKAEEQARLARENVQLVKASLDTGAASYIEWVDATSAMRGAELARINEQLNAELAALKLAKVAGLFNP